MLGIAMYLLFELLHAFGCALSNLRDWLPLSSEGVPRPLDPSLGLEVGTL